MKWVRLFAVLVCACGQPAAPVAPAPVAPTPTTPTPATLTPARGPITLSIVGTNDLHGAIDRLPLFAGFVANLRAARAADGGGVLLLDGGDMFQGTLESNLAEGADIVRAYNALGYVAVAVGNHEFDYGPVGPAVTPHAPQDDPRGALKARASEAKYPFVVSNILDEATGARIAWPNMPASTVVEVAGIKIGVIGASTQSTPHTTMSANFAGLRMAATAPAIAAEAAALRARGAQLIVATMHIGSACKDFAHSDDPSSCDRKEEIFKLIDALPRGTVDVMVGGHTHAGIAHMIGGVAVIESFANGRAFGRVDLKVGADGKIAGVAIAAPHLMCALDRDNNPVPVAACQPGDYEGQPVRPDPAIQAIADEAIARAAARRGEKLGVTLRDTVKRAHKTESAEGNWFGDLMLAARPDAQVALTNGGGLRADLPAGELTYGQLFEALPFDNRFAIVEVTGAHLRRLVTTNLTHDGAFLSWGGLSAKATCAAGKLAIELRVGGKLLDDRATYKLATSDFLATGGDGLIGRLKLSPDKIHITDVIIRDALADVLKAKKGAAAQIAPAALLDRAHPRLAYPGTRPVTCGGAAEAAEPGE